MPRLIQRTQQCTHRGVTAVRPYLDPRQDNTIIPRRVGFSQGIAVRHRRVTVLQLRLFTRKVPPRTIRPRRSVIHLYNFGGQLELDLLTVRGVRHSVRYAVHSNFLVVEVRVVTFANVGHRRHDRIFGFIHRSPFLFSGGQPAAVLSNISTRFQGLSSRR